MIAACDYDGFILDACQIIKPECNANDDEPVSY